VAPYRQGDVIHNRYLVKRVLASGGMADVYLATDRESSQEVVLKLPHMSLAGDLAAFNRYQRELEIARELEHPGLQKLLSETNTPYMVFEYIEGESLRAYLSQRRTLELEEALSIGRQLANILEYVHAHGVVHRDLKPENILIDVSGRVTLTDFGIALKLASRRLTFSHLSNAAGTPDYMAPEQVRGERGDARTDVYALGCVLFELLTGRVPYPVDDALEAMRRKVETEPPLLQRWRPDAPPALQAVVYRALRRRPAERYQTMAELAHDLSHLSDVVIPATYATDIPPPKPVGDLPPWRTTLTILGIILLILVAAGMLAQLAHHPAAAH
jgi:eukaryotic-like serine/threonine-protein kinase